MKLFPPQSELKLYEQGFGEDDLLGRRHVGQRLSELLERVDDPVVVALDGPWGSGKTHFLKRWVGAHTVENEGKATVIYFDAFANDYLDDPLIGLTGAIGDRLPKGGAQTKWKKAKTAAYKLSRPAVRIALAAATAGVTEIAAPVIDAAAEAGRKEAEKAAEAFWKREDGRKAAMDQFHSALSQLTAPSKEGADDGKPLIVVIDELDRCRPDYALGVLEVLKHFFAVPKVHFVLGVNLEALEHMVGARYGRGVNAGDYLKRFVSLSLKLPEFVDQQGEQRAQLRYFSVAAEEMGIVRALKEEAGEQLAFLAETRELSLRDIEKILTRLALMPQRAAADRMYKGWKTIIVSLVLMQVVQPGLYERALRGRVNIAEIDEFFGVRTEMLDRETESYRSEASIIRELWQFALLDEAQLDEERRDAARAFDSFGARRAERILPAINRDFFSLFSVAE